MAAEDIGRALRTLRERRGWTRETLAHHAGVSWAAIAQIEAGRRPNPRLSTLAALADALGVSVDQLSGRGTGPAPILEHRMLPYASDEEFFEAAVPFLADGVERSHAVLVLADRARNGQLRRTLGADAGKVEFRASATFYASPQAALDAFDMFHQERVRAGAPWVRVLGEPLSGAQMRAEVHTWMRAEAWINVRFASNAATVMCAYDTRTLPESIVDKARCTHPVAAAGPNVVANTEYCEPEAFLLRG